MALIALFSIFSSIVILSFAIPIDLNLKSDVTDDIDFNINLPNNDTVQIHLSFRLLKITNLTKTITTTTTTEPTTPVDTNTTHIQNDVFHYSSTENGFLNPKDTDVEIIPPEEKKIVTLKEAIEAFRQDLIKKEKDIGGLIQSDHIFYRRFDIAFEQNKSIKIRCAYDSNYQQRLLRISCFEYHEIEGERILSNGEVEYFTENDPTQTSDIIYVDLNKMKQTLYMDISK